MQKKFEKTQKGRKEIVPDKIKRKAIRLLFPNDAKISSRAISKIDKFIDKKFSQLNCCVLYRVSPDFKALCDQLGLDSQNREVIILYDSQMLFSSNFFGPHGQPRPVK